MYTDELWVSHIVQVHGWPKDKCKAYMTVTKKYFMLGIPAAVITTRNAPKTGGCHHTEHLLAHEQCIK